MSTRIIRSACIFVITGCIAVLISIVAAEFGFESKADGLFIALWVGWQGGTLDEYVDGQQRTNGGKGT